METTKKQPGRPPAGGDQAVRQQLLTAARGLFAKQGYDAVSIRAVAEAARVNPAMIHYYFGSKQGLYEAMLAATLAPLIERLGQVLSGNDDTSALKNFFALYMRTLGANPWMPPLILREVVAEGGHLRACLIQREQAVGRIRADADPSMTALSMVSLAVFPFVAIPVASEVFGMRVKEDYLDRFIAHTERVFLQGVSP